MNLFLKSYKIYLIFFFILALKGHELQGNEHDSIRFLSPRILKYELPNKYLGTPNTSFHKTEEGVIYIGKENGVLVLDGESIHFLPMKGPIFITSADDGELHYLATNDFGIITYSPNIGIQISSQINKIKSHYSQFIPYNLVTLDSLVFMATSEGIIKHNENIFQHFFFKRHECKLFKTTGSVFLDVKNDGLYIWKDSLFTKAFNSNIQKNKIIHITESETRYNIVFDNGISLTADKSFSDFIKSPAYLAEKALVTMVPLPNGYSLTISEDNRINLYSDDTGSRSTLDVSGALPYSKIITVYTDKFRDIWIVYPFELYKLEYPSHIYSLILPEGIQGNILKTLVIDDNIYLGTNIGLVILNTIQNEKWLWKTTKQFEEEYINQLENYEDAVFAGGNKSLYEIRGNSVSLIDRGTFTGLTVLNKEILFACNENGLTRYHKTDQKWTSDVVDHSLGYVIDMHAFINRIWYIGEDNIIHSFDDLSQTFHEYYLQEDIAVNFVSLKDRLFLIGEKNLWFWNVEKEKFQKSNDESISQAFLSSDIINQENDLIWMLRRNRENEFNISSFDLEKGIIPFHGAASSSKLNYISDISYSGDYLWLTGEDRLIRVCLEFPSDSIQNTVRIEKVCRYSSKTKCSTIEENERISYRREKITFSLDNLRFQTDPEPYYRYRLNKYQDEWSEWSQENQISFGGLKERKYIFQAQSRTISGGISNTVVFHFSIAPPIYRSWYAYLIYLLFLFTAIFLILKWRLLSFQRIESRAEAEIKDKMDNLIREKAKSDKLLNDMFPKGTAEELKMSGRAKSEKYELATVLFSDIQGFTKIAEEMNPEVLIDELDKFFFHFDSVVDKYNIEKIKTIGDAYMAAGGIPVKNCTNPVEVVLAGLEVQQYMNDLKKSKTDIWDLRIGIHTGPVISGVVGHKKLSYDIWGDTVNTASRMESSGEGGKVNISGVTYSYVKDFFLCEYRGKLPVKYKGNIDMYFVTGLRPELSVDLQGIPNRRFFLKLQLLRIQDLESRVFDQILGDHPGTFHFHSREHIRKIYNQTELLCRAENIGEEDILLTLSASLLLYSGMSESYEHFENRSVGIAREILPDFSYSEKQIDAICNLILATKIPYNPQNKLESILIDAKMEYIGRPDFNRMIKLLFLELKSNEREIPMQKLIKDQISLLKEFNYFTVAGQRLREISGEEQIAILESEI